MWVACSSQLLVVWFATEGGGDTTKAEMSPLIRPDAPVLRHSQTCLPPAPVVAWRQSTPLIYASFSPSRQKNPPRCALFDPIGHAHQHHLVRTEEIKEKVYCLMSGQVWQLQSQWSGVSSTPPGCRLIVSPANPSVLSGLFLLALLRRLICYTTFTVKCRMRCNCGKAGSDPVERKTF